MAMLTAAGAGRRLGCLSAHVCRGGGSSSRCLLPHQQHRCRRAFAAAAAAGSGSGTHFDYLVLGAGSGGMASARRAADLYGAKVAVVESGRLGGTCVNVGCVPKKVMWNAAMVKEMVEGAGDYGHNFDHSSYAFDWGKVKASRDSYVARLNGIYERNLDNSGVTLLSGEASFSGRKTVTVGGTSYSADHVLIAVGGHPTLPGAAEVPGAAVCGIDSDGFFELAELPKKAAVVGAGYIAVELAGVLKTLGSEVDLFVSCKALSFCCASTVVFLTKTVPFRAVPLDQVRGDGALRRFDTDIAGFLNKQMVADGVELVTGSNLRAADRQPDGTITLDVSVEGTAAGGGASTVTKTGYDCLIFAVGRAPAVGSLGLEQAGVEQRPSGHIAVDEYQNTSAEGVYALGDVCGVDELTPVCLVCHAAVGQCFCRAAVGHARTRPVLLSSLRLSACSC
eukprot:SAG22_NODE_1909_length_3328_cov_3.374419_4_plen_450_part_00